MSNPMSRRDSRQESHDPSPTQPYQAELTTSTGHPIHPTTSTSTHAPDAMDGSTSTALVTTGIVTTCCEIHRPTGCCDPNDCGPCCPDCPTCPTLDELGRGEEFEHATTVRPVMPVVARTSADEESAETRLIDRRCRCSRPAAELHRSCLWHDSVSSQYAADLLAEVRRLRDREAALIRAKDVDLDDVRDELEQLRVTHSVDVKAIGVLSAAVTKVAALHVDDGDGWCKACQTLGYPCPTAIAIGADQ